MSASMPWSLVIAWSIFFMFVSTHQRFAKDFQGRSQGYRYALTVSMLLGTLIGLSLMLYYCFQVTWYWPIVLFLVGSFIASMLFVFLLHTIGTLSMSLLAFIGWPASAVWAFLIIRGLNH